MQDDHCAPLTNSYARSMHVVIVLGVLVISGTSSENLLHLPPQNNLAASSNLTQLLPSPLVGRSLEHVSDNSRHLRSKRQVCQHRLLLALIPKTSGRDMRVKLRDYLEHQPPCNLGCALEDDCLERGAGIMFVHIDPVDKPFRTALWKNSWKYNFTLVSFIRDPVERVISEYYFLKKGGFSNQIYATLIRDRGWHSLEEYAKALTNRNYMTGFLLGFNPWSHVVTEMESKQLLQNVRDGFRRNLLFLGVLEQYLMSWRLFKMRLNLSPRHKTGKILNKNYLKPLVNASLKRKIRNWNKLDAELYKLGLSHLLNLSKSVDSSWFLESQNKAKEVATPTIVKAPAAKSKSITISVMLKKLEEDLAIENPPKAVRQRLYLIEENFYGKDYAGKGSVKDRLKTLWDEMY